MSLQQASQQFIAGIQDQLPARSRTILFVTNADGFGGTEKHLLELINRLPRSVTQIVILQVGAGVYEDHLKGNDALRIATRSEKVRNSLWGWFRYFRSNRPDIVVFVNGWVRSFSWSSPLAAFLAGVPRRFAIQHLIAPTLAKVEGWSIGSVLRRLIGGRRRTRIASTLTSRFCDTTICVSKAVRDRLVTDYRFPADKTITIHNGVSVSEFVPSQINRVSVRTTLGLGSQEFLFVCVARLSEVKGLDILLRAMARVLHEGSVCKCIIVGGGPLRKELVEQSEVLGLRGHMFFAGFHKDVRPFLQAADAFILTSHREGFPLSILEAMACGLPCIVTDVGGNAEAVHHMVHGLVVAAGSVEQTADAISYLVRHPKERAEMSKAALARVRERYDVEASMAEITRVILS